MNLSSRQSLQPHPEKLRLSSEIERFGETLTQLIVQRDYLQRSVLLGIAAEYQLKIGHLETRAFWLDCELRALRRRIELAQAQLNSGEKPCYQNIEQQINREFAEWRANIAAKQRELAAAREFDHAPKMSREDFKKLHTLYRNLAKKLHPDVTGETSERARKLWQQTADAYRDADAATLEALWIIVENQSAAPETAQSDTLENLGEKREKLFAAIIQVNDEIAKIRQAAPYIWQNILCDEGEIIRRRQAAISVIEDLRRSRLELTKHWATVMQSAKNPGNAPREPPALVAEETAETRTTFPEFLREHQQ